MLDSPIWSVHQFLVPKKNNHWSKMFTAFPSEEKKVIVDVALIVDLVQFKNYIAKVFGVTIL